MRALGKLRRDEVGVVNVVVGHAVVGGASDSFISGSFISSARTTEISHTYSTIPI
jgi:hypothetical protein